MTSSASATASPQQTFSLEELEFYERSVRPVLADHCYPCHSRQSKRVKAGLLLDSRESLLTGGDNGPVLVPRQSEASTLIHAIKYDDPDLQMPPKGKLSEPEIHALTEWVQRGAAWPAESRRPADDPARAAFDLAARRKAHWAWQPIRLISLPPVSNADWPRQPVDRFVLAALEDKGLSPAPVANRRTLIRRLNFDLIGLPPTPQEIEEFAADPDPDAYARLVDRLLASPHFGERWARHWLDLVRYAETLGHEFDYPRHHAWRYRDYVIRSLNADVPYDQFVKEHIAGDLLCEPRRHPDTGFNESVLATAFYWFGQQTHSPVDVHMHQAGMIDNQIDVLTKTFLGLTVSCARCHDHKFDAISTRDFYSLYGMIASSRYTQAPIDGPHLPPENRRALEELKTEINRSLMPLRPTGEDTPVAEQDNLPAGPTNHPAAASQTLPGDDLLFADFSRGIPDGWRADGEAFNNAYHEAEEFIISDTDPARATRLAEAGLHTGRLANRLQGSLRSPTFDIAHRYIHLRALGRESRVNLVIRNFTLIRNPIYGSLKRVLDSDQPEWITLDVERWHGERAYLEFLDRTVPDPADGAKSAGYDANGYLGIYQVVFSTQKAPPTWGTKPPGEEIDMDLADHPALAELIADHQSLASNIPLPSYAPAMADGNGVDEPVYVRGNPRAPGDRVPRQFLTALGGAPLASTGNGSGRLEFAHQLLRMENPFPARVMVNRVWLHLFGEGIVPTPDDFGVLGQPPTHPDLLDWLAHTFRTDYQWSLKMLIRQLVTSSTYRMSSQPNEPFAEEVDPDNRWLHRMRVRRLEGEVIRDSLLAISGRLNPSIGGPPIKTHLTPFMDGRGRPGESGPLDGAGRRSIYLEVRNNFLSPMMRAFDTPIPFTTIGRRTVSNVPAQSLILLNDSFVHGEAERWATALLETHDTDARARIQHAYDQALGRPADGTELHLGLSFIADQTAIRSQETNREVATSAAWADFCHVLFNTKEFIYLN